MKDTNAIIFLRDTLRDIVSRKTVTKLFNCVKGHFKGQSVL